MAAAILPSTSGVSLQLQRRANLSGRQPLRPCSQPSVSRRAFPVVSFYQNSQPEACSSRRLNSCRIGTREPSSSGGRGRGLACRGLFGLGFPELLVVGGVAVVLFGPKQLPEIGKSLGKTVKGFQEAAKEFQTELKEATKGEITESSTDAAKAPEKPSTESKNGESK